MGMWLADGGKHGPTQRDRRLGEMLHRRTFTRYGCNMDTVLLAAVVAAVWSCVVGMEYIHDEPAKIFMNEHVCEEVMYINRTVLRRTSYVCKVREQVRCTSWFKSDVCTKYRTKLCYRNVSVVIPDVAVERVCCPGWTEDDNGSCTRPVCPDGCKHGGVCGADPTDANLTTCLCLGGLTGIRCETDVDECAERNDTCSHVCGNTFGSYFCACFAGNILAPDGVTCLTNHSAEDNGTLPVAPLHDKRVNDATPVMLGSLLGGATVVMLVLLCAVIAVVRFRRKRPSLEDRMDAPRSCTQNNYIGLSEFDQVDDSILVLTGASGVQESSTDDSPALGRTDPSRFDVGGNEYVIDGEYASHWYEDADADGAAACARTDDRPREPGKSNPTGALTYDYAYGVGPALKPDDTTNGKPGSNHYECVAASSPYDYAYGATFVRQSTRKVRLPETTDGYLTPVCVCPPQQDGAATGVPSEYLHCDDAPGASVYENSVLGVRANHRTTHGDVHRPNTVADGGYLTTDRADEDGDDAVYQNSQPACRSCSSDSIDACRKKKQPDSSCDNVYMLPVPRPRKTHIDSPNSVEPDVYVKYDVDNTDESIYCNTLPDTHTTRTQDNAGDTQMGSSCSTLSKTDDAVLDDSDYVSGDVNRDSADYENWDSPKRDELVYENCRF